MSTSMFTKQLPISATTTVTPSADVPEISPIIRLVFFSLRLEIFAYLLCLLYDSSLNHCQFDIEVSVSVSPIHTVVDEEQVGFVAF